jgi:hypothetical protein
MKNLFMSEIATAIMTIIGFWVFAKLGLSAQESLLPMIVIAFVVLLYIVTLHSWIISLWTLAAASVAIATIAIVKCHCDDTTVVYSATAVVLSVWLLVKVSIDSTVPFFLSLLMEMLGVWGALEHQWTFTAVCGTFLLGLFCLAWKIPEYLPLRDPEAVPVH